jgi:hypothetical protein
MNEEQATIFVQAFLDKHANNIKTLRLTSMAIIDDGRHVKGLTEDEKGSLQVAVLGSILEALIRDSNVPKEVRLKLLSHLQRKT